MTSSLPRKCSTTELRGRKNSFASPKRWSGKRDSNPRPSAWKADALANWAIPASSTNLKTQDGEGRIRTSEGWADRFTVCSLWPLGNLPALIGGRLKITSSATRRQYLKNTRPQRGAKTLKFSFQSCQFRWSWQRDSNPRPADYKSAALPTELRQPSKRKTLIVQSLPMACQL